MSYNDVKLYLHCNAAQNRNMIKQRKKNNQKSDNDNNYGDGENVKKNMKQTLIKKEHLLQLII